jgi:transposase
MEQQKWIQAHREPKTEIKCIKGMYYKYEITYRYNKEKKRTDKLTGKLLGKITETAGFIPSDKDALRQKRSIVPAVDIKTFGVYNLFSNLLKEEIQTLKEKIKSDVVERLLVFSMMRWAYQSPIKRVPSYHAHDFCSEDWSSKTLSDKHITETLKIVGEDRASLVEWMQMQLALTQSEDSQFVMMDSTHVTSVSDLLSVNAKGYNPSHNFDKQIRLMYIFSAELKSPVYYRLINGNITDLKSMSLCIKEMNLENVVLIADKGFYSKENISQLEQEHIEYIIPVHRNNKLIDLSPLKKGDLKKEIRKYFVYQERIIWYYNYENDGQKCITFLDEKLKVKEESDYLLRIKTYPETYSEELFYEKHYVFGTLTVVYSLKKEQSPSHIYEAYKQRNEVEVMFDSYKNFLHADKSYMQNRHVMEGWLMANFIAMIAYYKLYSRLQKANLLSKYSPKDIIELSKSIYKLKIGGEWTTSEITVKTKKLFKEIEIDYLK